MKPTALRSLTIDITNDKDTEEKQDLMDLSAEERAIIEKQIREDEL